MIRSFTEQRLSMVDGQIKPFSVADTRVLHAFTAVPREIFLPAAQQSVAYIGEDLPCGEGRYLIEAPAYARLLQEAAIQSHETVLDVGCLTGYTTAILKHLAGTVVGIDQEKLITKAKKLTQHWHANAALFQAAELTEGAPRADLYDAIVINGAVQVIPPALIAQLKEGGRIATFWRDDAETGRGNGRAILFHKHNGVLTRQELFDAFVPVLPGFALTPAFEF